MNYWFKSERSAHKFKYKQFEAGAILWVVHWHCKFSFSYRNFIILVQKRGLQITHTTTMHWAHEYVHKLENKIKIYFKQSIDSYRVDKTHIRIKWIWHYLYRAVDSHRQRLAWILIINHYQKMAKKCIKEIQINHHCRIFRFINIKKAKVFLPTFTAYQVEKVSSVQIQLRQQKHLNNIQEQDYRFVKRRVRCSKWFKSNKTAEFTQAEYEAMYILHKDRLNNVGSNDASAYMKHIHQLFRMAA